MTDTKTVPCEPTEAMLHAAEMRSMFIAHATDPARELWRAMLAAAPAHQPDRQGAGWVVTNSNGDRWRCWTDGFSTWTDDAAKATRYARRQDAEAVHAHDEDAWRIVPFADDFPGASVPRGCTGVSLAFEPGVLHVAKDGSGYIAVEEGDFSLEDDRCDGPDGPEGSIHWIVRLAASEMVALRDFLNAAAPPPTDTAMRELKADFVRSHPSGFDDSTYEKIENALDRLDAPVCDADGKWLTLAERIATLSRRAAAEGRGDPAASAVAADALRRFNAFVDRKAMMDKLGHPLTGGEWPQLVEATRAALTAIAGDAEEAEACGICHVAFVDDDLCLTDVDLGTVHARCCGPERESYVNLVTLEPLGADEPIPTGWRWGDAQPAGGSEEGEATAHG